MTNNNNNNNRNKINTHPKSALESCETRKMRACRSKQIGFFVLGGHHDVLCPALYNWLVTKYCSRYSPPFDPDHCSIRTGSLSLE